MYQIFFSDKTYFLHHMPLTVKMSTIPHKYNNITNTQHDVSDAV